MPVAITIAKYAGCMPANPTGGVGFGSDAVVNVSPAR